MLILSLCWFVVATGYEFRQLPLRDYSAEQCDLVENPAGPVLRILDAVYMEDLGVMSTWCQSPGLSRRYASIVLRSVHRDRFDLRELYESRYDLVLAKPELIISGSVEKGGIGYELIARYPQYGSQLVSLHGTPELSAAWMKGKILGLLDDPNSVSAYQIPKTALRNSGLTKQLEIVYFRSHRQLYNALFEGRVDIIPALISNEGPDSVLQIPPGLVLQEVIPGPGWYIHRKLMQTPEHCELLVALENLASSSRVGYLRDLRIVGSCYAD